MRALFLLLACSLAASAGEYALLSNGFRIHADSHSTEGTVIKLNTAQGVIELPANTVTGFEKEEYTPPPPAAVPETPPTAVEEADRSLTPKELVTRAANRAGLP